MRSFYTKGFVISLYLSGIFIYMYCDRKIYTGVLNDKYILLPLSVIILITTLNRFLSQDKKKVMNILCLIIWIIFLIIALISFPRYTYENAKTITKERYETNQRKMIEPTNIKYSGLVGLRKMYKMPPNSMIVEGDYLFYFETGNAIEWYMFDNMNGTIKLYDTVPYNK